MAARQTQSRTVRFFETTDRKTGLPLDHELPWEAALQALQTGVTVDERTVKLGGDDHHGGPWMMDGYPSMLLLSRIRDDFELPELFDRKDGSLDLLEVAESKGVAETTHIGFFPQNIVGMIRTNTTPGAGNFESWLNKMEIFDDLDPVDIAPLSRVSVTKRVRDIDQARGISVRMRTSAAQSIAHSAPRLADAVQTLNEKFGPVMVEMRIYIPRDQGYSEESDTIMNEAQGLLSLTAEGHAVDGLEAAKLFYKSREKEKADDINMLKDKLAETVEVEVLDTAGRSTRRSSAARAMQRAYTALEEDLLTAVRRPRETE